DVGKIRSHCTCQAWNRYGPHCKHVVAAALVYLARMRQAALREAARREGLEVAVPSATTSRGTAAAVAVSDPMPAPAAGEDGDGETPESDAALRPASPDGGVPTLPALAKLENWLGLSALSDLEFFYRITPNPGTSGARTWVMD